MAQKSAKPADARLDPNPFEAEGLGLKINLPAGAAVSAEKVNGQLVVVVNDDPSMPTWTMRMQSLTSAQANPTAASQIADLLQEFDAGKQNYQIIANTPFVGGNRQGQLCYIQRRFTENQPVVSGWLVLPTGETTFMVLSIQTLPEHMPRVRPMLEASFTTIELRDTEEVALERRNQFDAGRAFIESITPEGLRAHVGLSQWFRIYSPAASDGSAATELGYSLLEVLDAKKGSLDPSKPEQKYDTGERKPGIMIRIQGRVVMDPQRNLYYDSIALYWMAWDQSEEAWSIRGTQRQGEAEHSEAETGLRSPYIPGELPPRLIVIKSDNTTNSREPFDWQVPDVYLSQPLGWLLGRLLPKSAGQDQEYRYYFYNFANRIAQVSQRSDVWGRLNDGSGNFRLVTRLTSDSQPITSIYNSKGELIRRIHAGGSVTEPSTVENIQKLWKSKGLQVGKSN